MTRTWAAAREPCTRGIAAAAATADAPARASAQPVHRGEHALVDHRHDVVARLGEALQRVAEGGEALPAALDVHDEDGVEPAAGDALAHVLDVAVQLADGRGELGEHAGAV